MQGELIRIAIAFLGLLATCYYDLFNNKNIPEKILYLFLGVALAINFIFFDYTLSVFAILLALSIGAIGLLFNKLGQLGSADVIVLSSIALLLPIHPSISNLPFNYPFVFSIIVFSGVLFAIYTVFYFGWKILHSNKTTPNLLALILLLPYAIFAYIYLQFPFFSSAYFSIVSLVVFSSIFFIIYKKDINNLLVEKVPLKKAEEEDVVAIEMMDKKTVDKYKISRVLSLSEIKRLKQLKIKELIIYKNLPPFLPFILLGFILSLFLSRMLMG
ncbi:MAG: hypothetical protein PHU63_04700 [Candidatus ainarchaeum sp.]|nr:hypothetical protein [Candidatus ainarchaeum sp.]